MDIAKSFWTRYRSILEQAVGRTEVQIESRRYEIGVAGKPVAVLTLSCGHEVRDDMGPGGDPDKKKIHPRSLPYQDTFMYCIFCKKKKLEDARREEMRKSK